MTDTFPEGPEKELSPTMEWPIHKAFIFREQHVRRAEDPYLHQVLRRYHRILVPHDKDSVPLPSFLKSDPRLSWTGPVLPADPLFSREESRKRLGIPEHRETLLLSFGGGGDPEAKQRAKNIAAFLRARNQSFFYASGPLARSLPEGIHAGEWLPLWPIRPYLKAFDGIVASGGYNTVHEVLESRIPAFLCDFPRALDPQADRIDRLVREGRVMTHSGQTLSGLLSSLETFLEKRALLSESLQTQSAPVSSGADTAARILLNILQPA